ncbi:Band 7 domain containing protein [uncultured Caudovirales phage]|uniref:Band 7 domain containing protein n=1 Tax=uncultured Caudovirales phage TaxID=2100421 RepID=A0A6J5MI77_9CAUD|nr:Band 7 domain containing protein [uncultured Caudovirales phage]
MKKSILFSMVAVAMLFTACNPVQPNFEGVLMQNYGRNGMADFTVVTGNQGILGPGSELYQVPMYEQAADPTQVSITAKDAGTFTVDPSFTYEAIRGKGIDIVFNYKHTNFDENMDNIENMILNPIVINAFREEARNFTTDSLMNNLNAFENKVQERLKSEFEGKFFKLNSLTSGLTPPASMANAIELRNNQKQMAEQVRNELEVARMQKEKAQIEQETNNIKSKGLTKEILMERYIDALRWSNNRIIITDGKAPVLIQP